MSDIIDSQGHAETTDKSVKVIIIVTPAQPKTDSCSDVQITLLQTEKCIEKLAKHYYTYYIDSKLHNIIYFLSSFCHTLYTTYITNQTSQ